MTTIATIALAGLQTSAKQAEVRSQNIANAYTPGYKAARVTQVSSPYGPAAIVDIPEQAPAATPPDEQSSSLDPAGNDVDLAEEIVGLKQAETSYKFSAKLLATVNDLADKLLDILA